MGKRKGKLQVARRNWVGSEAVVKVELVNWATCVLVEEKQKQNRL